MALVACALFYFGVWNLNYHLTYDSTKHFFAFSIIFNIGVHIRRRIRAIIHTTNAGVTRFIKNGLSRYVAIWLKDFTDEITM